MSTVSVYCKCTCIVLPEGDNILSALIDIVSQTLLMELNSSWSRNIPTAAEVLECHMVLMPHPELYDMQCPDPPPPVCQECVCHPKIPAVIQHTMIFTQGNDPRGFWVIHPHGLVGGRGNWGDVGGTKSTGKYFACSSEEREGNESWLNYREVL